jgi:hypothetical protein
MRLCIYKLVFLFLGFNKKNIKKVGFHSSYVGSLGFWVNLVDRSSLTGSITSSSFYDLKPNKTTGINPVS